MSNLVIDLNSIVTGCLLVGKDPDGYKVDGELINTFDYGYSNLLGSFRKTLDFLEIKPIDVIGVFDAENSRAPRKRIYDAYKAHRATRPKEYYEEFTKTMETFKKFIKELGGTIVSAKEREADDVIAHIAEKLDNAIIWSRDKDMLHVMCEVYLLGDLYSEETCEGKFLGIHRRHIPLYRTLVSDVGDFGKGMGAQGFGDGAFLDLMARFGEEGMDELMTLIAEKRLGDLDADDLATLPTLQKVINSSENVYTTWRLAKWVAIKDSQLKWELGYVNPRTCETFDLEFDEYYQNETLVTKENLEKCKKMISRQLVNTPFVSLDIESDVDENSDKWIKDIQDNIRKDAMYVDAQGSNLCGLSITIGDNLQHTYYFSVNHLDTDNVSSADVKEVITGIKGLYFLAHNASGFELPVLFNNWGAWIPNMLDSMIAASYVDENSRKGLKVLTSYWLGASQQSYQDVTGGLKMSQITGEKVLSYGCDDTIMAGALFNGFRHIMRVEETYEVFKEVETDAQYMVASAFKDGIGFDVNRLKELQVADQTRYDESFARIETYLIANAWEGAVFVPLTELTAAELKRGWNMIQPDRPIKTSFRIVSKVAAAFGGEYEKIILESESTGNLEPLNEYLCDNFKPRVKFKPTSPKDMKKLLYEDMAAPIRFRGDVTVAMRQKGQKLGAPTTDADSVKWAIRDLSGDNFDAEDDIAALKDIVICKECATRNSLYYKPYPWLAHWSDGKLHVNLRQSVTTSRRFGPSGPNVNQIPKRSEEGKKVRETIVPHKKRAAIVAPDFTGQELRLAAEDSQDENFLSCYIGDNLKDLHSITAFRIDQKLDANFGSYSELVKANTDGAPAAKLVRGYGKSTNFLSQYGGSAPTLSKKLTIPEKDCQLFLDAKDEAFPGVKPWSDQLSFDCMRRGYSTTFLGARKHIHRIIHTQGEAHVLRSAVNFRIQSSAAEQTKIVLGKVWRAGLLEKYDAVFYMTVHDELVFSVAHSDLDAFCKELQPLMEYQYADMKVPCIATLSIGPNFGKLSDFAWDNAQEYADLYDNKNHKPVWEEDDVPF